MKNVRMMAWISIFIMLAACDFVDPHTLNIDVKKNEAGPTSSLQHSGGVENKKDGQIYDFTLFDIDAFPVSLNKFRGKVLLLVNTASRCGYTPQYEQLQQLYEQYQPRGLEILAFPSKDFGGQELETNEAIATFCYTRYSVDFPLFAKTKIRGENKHPLYRYLTEKSPFKGEVRWNFEKYLVDRKGSVIARYYSSVLPLSEEIISDLERALALPS
jgi:glutathione peroxidase